MLLTFKETGDWTILDEPVPFDNEPGSEQPIYVHLQKSIQYTLGPAGSTWFAADWESRLEMTASISIVSSDQPGQSFQTTTNKDGTVAESVFIAGLFVLACREMEEIARRTGRVAESLGIREARWRWKKSSMMQAGMGNGSAGHMIILELLLAPGIATWGDLY